MNQQSKNRTTLIEIEGFLINPDRIDFITTNTYTNIYVGGSEIPIQVVMSYKEVIALLRSNGVNVA